MKKSREKRPHTRQEVVDRLYAIAEELGRVRDQDLRISLEQERDELELSLTFASDRSTEGGRAPSI
ncbi:MAG: hypothetical protein Q7S48_03655 [bacterium]|nr:hypothetical protein [bacterium]